MEININRTDSLPGGASSILVPLARTFPAVSGNDTENLLRRRRPDTSSLPSEVTQQQEAIRPSSSCEKAPGLPSHRRSAGHLVTGLFQSPFFLVPKPDGSFRPIIDLKKLNLFLDIPAFKMESLFSIIAALQPQEWITKIYLKDAYYHILIHVNIRKYFRFDIAEKTYQFHLLPLVFRWHPESLPRP